MTTITLHDYTRDEALDRAIRDNPDAPAAVFGFRTTRVMKPTTVDAAGTAAVLPFLAVMTEGRATPGQDMPLYGEWPAQFAAAHQAEQDQKQARREARRAARRIIHEMPERGEP